MDSVTGTTADWFVTFKPLYTLQPVKATRDKQLKVWADLILRHCRENNLTSIHPATFPLFRNDAIDRQLSPDGIAAVVDIMIASGTPSISSSRGPLFSPHHPCHMSTIRLRRLGRQQQPARAADHP